MTQSTAPDQQPTINARDRVIEEMGAALERLGNEIPEADAAQILRLAIGYFAGVHAHSFGHVATVRAIITIARRGLWSANEQLTAPRH